MLGMSQAQSNPQLQDANAQVPTVSMSCVVGQVLA